MNGYNILIIEDDSNIAASLSEMLEILNHNVAGVADSYEVAIKELETKDIQLALVDIQLRGDKSGIEVAEQLKNNYKIPFIFTTAFADKETIEKAAVHSPYGYIVKPYSMKEINAGIEIAVQNHANLKNLKAEDEGVFNQSSLFIKSNSRLVRVAMDDILYVEAKGDYAVFKTEQKGYVVHTTFKNVEEKLDPQKFVKVHRSYIVNIDKVVDIEENNLLIKEQVIPISRGQKPNLLKRLNTI
ncbi:LytR/AlgR family response regulator transcription factor [Roseivirga sp. BDSF3-8]|uniref:LytR/AlgR family response regulator transcription factor n=1 Tax=Roseivirga sp. BDSF3-8 TaxID=3241598 RepID=UPI0035323F21